MRFLADESCDFSIVRALRAAGHDVLAIAEGLPGADDEVVIAMAVEQDRALLTEDRDFGQLVFAHGWPGATVIYIRYPAGARAGLSRAALELVEDQGEALTGSFVVLQPGRARISRTPR